MHEKGIIVFTKDQPERLSKTLPSVTNIDVPVIVLDDSINPLETKNVVDDFVKKNDGIYYHGIKEQKKLIQKVSKEISNGSDLTYFIKPLGTNGWNLGYVRNYAIILAKVMNFKRVIFKDDDIIVTNRNIFQQLLNRLNNADFVGAEIKGMPDNSLTEHILIACGEKIDNLASGGFLAFNLNKTSEYFLNYYNEDQIWLYLHSAESKIETFCEVEQLEFDQFEGATKKAITQQFGEILRDGVIEAREQNDFTLLLRDTFWYEILEIEIDYIKKLKKLCNGINVETIAMDVHDALMDYHLNIGPESFVNVFMEYFNMKYQWKSILDKLDGNVEV